MKPETGHSTKMAAVSTTLVSRRLRIQTGRSLGSKRGGKSLEHVQVGKYAGGLPIAVSLGMVVVGEGD